MNVWKFLFFRVQEPTEIINMSVQSISASKLERRRGDAILYVIVILSDKEFSFMDYSAIREYYLPRIRNSPPQNHVLSWS